MIPGDPITAMPETWQGTMDEFSVTLHFDYSRPPLSANKSYNRWERARLTSDVRLAAKLLAHRIPALGKIRVSLVWVVTDRRRRDGGENITPTLKPMIDGLVDAGVVTDDTPDLVIRVMPVIEYRPDEKAHMELTVEMIS